VAQTDSAFHLGLPTDGNMEILRQQSNPQTFYRDDDLFVDLRQQVVILDSETVRLTRMEYRLLALLVQHAGKVVPRAILLMQVCGYVAETRTRALDMHVRRLRKKLRRAGQRIATIIGRGYCFNPFYSLHDQGPSEPDALANKIADSPTVVRAPALACQTCADLLANLKLSVDLYKTAVRNVLERVGDEHEAAVEQAECSRQECLAAIDALMAHRRQDMVAHFDFLSLYRHQTLPWSRAGHRLGRSTSGRVDQKQIHSRVAAPRQRRPG
jgi:DNA-binding winged helix-turn-helix (wHTH) protein